MRLRFADELDSGLNSYELLDTSLETFGDGAGIYPRYTVSGHITLVPIPAAVWFPFGTTWLDAPKANLNGIKSHGATWPTAATKT